MPTVPFFAYFAITRPHADLDYPDLSAYEHAFPETPFVNESGRRFKTQLKPKAAYASMAFGIPRPVSLAAKSPKSGKVLDLQ